MQISYFGNKNDSLYLVLKFVELILNMKIQ